MEVDRVWEEGCTTDSGHEEYRIYRPQGHLAELLSLKGGSSQTHKTRKKLTEPTQQLC